MKDILPRFYAKEIVKEPSSAQMTIANLQFYLYLRKTIDKASKTYAERKRFERRGIWDDAESLSTRIGVGIEDLYFTSNKNPKELENFNKQWGEEADLVKSLLSQIEPKLQKKRIKFSANATSLNFLQRRLVMGEAIRKLSTFTVEQQTRVFEQIGYNRDEAIDIAKKIGISMLAGSAATAVAYSLVGATSTLGFTEPFLRNSTNINTALSVMSSYMMHYGTLGVTSEMNNQLLEQNGSSPNIQATIVYYILKKMYPDSKKLQEAGVSLATFTPVLLQEIGFLPALFTPLGPSVVTLRNISGAVYNSALILADKTWLRRGKK